MARFKQTDRTTDFGKKMQQTIKELKGKPYVKTGWPAAHFSKIHDEDEKNAPAKSTGTHVDKKVGAKERKTVGEIAIIQEYGSRDGHIPERAPIRGTFDIMFQAWKAYTAKVRDQVVSGKITVKQALDLIGYKQEADIKRRVRARLEPANSASTIAQKGSSTPLIDTGQMIQMELSHEVVLEGKKAQR